MHRSMNWQLLWLNPEDKTPTAINEHFHFTAEEGKGAEEGLGTPLHLLHFYELY